MEDFALGGVRAEDGVHHVRSGVVMQGTARANFAHRPKHFPKGHVRGLSRHAAVVGFAQRHAIPAGFARSRHGRRHSQGRNCFRSCSSGPPAGGVEAGKKGSAGRGDGQRRQPRKCGSPGGESLQAADLTSQAERP